MSGWILLFLLAGGAADSDRDGLDDAQEGALLEQFLPSFRISQGDCDGRPAEFQPGRTNPRVLARNGVIYGRAFPVAPAGLEGRFIELHYYHLWGRDCGRAGHPLDTEHVAALLRAEPSGWRALYWYAAAHEETACDTSSAAPAAFLDAAERGPAVWISRGKHASYLGQAHCAAGCGSDRCDRSMLLEPPKVVNLGEPGAPLNGALWAASPRWRLAAKFASDFTPGVLARLDGVERGIVLLRPELGKKQAVVRASGSTAGALATAGRSTDAAMDTAAGKTGGAVKTGAGSVKRALGRAARWVGQGKE